MSQAWIAFYCGIVIGFAFGVIVISIFNISRYSKDYIDYGIYYDEECEGCDEE